MNLILAVGLFAIVMVGIGVRRQHHRRQRLRLRGPGLRVSASRPATDLPAGTSRRRRAQVGLQPGDGIVTFDGTPVTSWDQADHADPRHAGTTVALADRARRPADDPSVPIVAPSRRHRRPGNQTGTAADRLPRGHPRRSLRDPDRRLGVRAGPGSSSATPRTPSSASRPGSRPSGRSSTAPARRQLAGRHRRRRPICGEILALGHRAKDKLALFLQVLAGFNMSLFLLNLLPLLPLDGGHILGAVIEWVRRGWASCGEGRARAVRRGQADAGGLRGRVAVHRADRADRSSPTSSTR